MKHKDITPDQLTAYRAIYSKSCKAHCGDKESEGYARRKKEWNDAKEAVAFHVHDATPAASLLKAFAKVKPNGAHKAGHSYEPEPGSVLFESLEGERIALMDQAREILATGHGYDGAPYEYGENKKLDGYVLRAIKQDGRAREPLASHPIQERILSLNDSGEWKADRAAAIRWLAWRNRSIEHYRKEAAAIAIESMQENAAKAGKGKKAIA